MTTIIDINIIKKYLKNPQNITIEVFDSIASTNDYLINKTDIDPRIIYACLAEEQTAGRGRLEKTWFSPAKQNIYLSLLLHSDRPVKEFSGLSVAVGHAVIEALQDYGIEELQMKYPNDILHAKQKLAGILIETFKQKNGLLAIVIGVGLNVNMHQGDIDQPWTSLQKITQKEHDRNLLASSLINEIIKCCTY